MIPAPFDYVVPTSLDEAVGALRDGGEDAKLLAGGHSLIPLMKLRLAAPSLLVDLRRVPGLTGVQRENGSWRIGALTTHTALSRAGLGLASAAASRIADPQVRNRGTIGGSLAHGDPASDLPAVMLACGATVTASRGSSGSREIAAADLFQDYMTTSLADDEVLSEIRLPTLDGYGFGYQKFNRRREDWAMVGVCALVSSDRSDVRIALTNMGAVPIRATAAEEAFKGGATVGEAASKAADGTTPPADLNASADYKAHLAQVLCKRALEAATA